jgi:hypothetical protein
MGSLTRTFLFSSQPLAVNELSPVAQSTLGIAKVTVPTVRHYSKIEDHKPCKKMHENKARVISPNVASAIA